MKFAAAMMNMMMPMCMCNMCKLLNIKYYKGWIR